MSALERDRSTPVMGAGGIPVRTSYPVKADAIIFKGALVALDATGYLVPGATSSSLIAVGRATQNVDATDFSSGELTCEVDQGVFQWVNGNSITFAAVGTLAYIVDDQTVSSNASGKSIAGTIFAVDDSGVWVYTGLNAPVDASALTAYISSIASTSLAEGAALVGINDAGNLYSGATVEAALQELITGSRFANVANVNTIGGATMVFRTTVTSGADGNLDITLGTGMKIRVLDAWAALKGAGTAGSTLQLKSTAAAISDVLDVSAGGDRDVFRIGEIDDANQEIVAGGILRWTKASTGGDFPGAECYVLACRVA